MSENPREDSTRAAPTTARYTFTNARNEGYKPSTNAIPPSLKFAPIAFGLLLVGFTLLLGGITFFGTREPVLTAFMSLLPVVLLSVPLGVSVRKFRGGRCVTGILGEAGSSQMDLTTGTVKNLKHKTVGVMVYEFTFTSPTTGAEIHGNQSTTEFRYQGPVAGDTVAVYFVNDKNFTLL
jgi:hypothetical protein